MAGSTPRPHIHAQINRIKGREPGRQRNPGLQHRGNKASNLRLKMPVGVGAAAGETPSLTGEVVGETHRGLKCAQAHPLGNQHQRGPV